MIAFNPVFHETVVATIMSLHIFPIRRSRNGNKYGLW